VRGRQWTVAVASAILRACLYPNLDIHACLVAMADVVFGCRCGYIVVMLTLLPKQALALAVLAVLIE
jgi:hypothetical protein